MRFTQELADGTNVIRGYGNGEIRVNDAVLRSSVIVSATELLLEESLRDVGAIGEDQVQRILKLAPEVVLLGSGPKQQFPTAALTARFLGAQIGFEVMTTGAACRTFNVLVAERRAVVALLVI